MSSVNKSNKNKFLIHLSPDKSGKAVAVCSSFPQICDTVSSIQVATRPLSVTRLALIALAESMVTLSLGGMVEPLQFIFAKPRNPALGWFPEQKMSLELNLCLIQAFSLRSIFTLLHCYIVTLLHCYIVTLLHCFIVILLQVLKDRSF